MGFQLLGFYYTVLYGAGFFGFMEFYGLAEFEDYGV